ncbi:MAG: Sua5/YciO/YrdC/YwlC family protein, partial [Actinomycetota bacterium]
MTGLVSTDVDLAAARLRAGGLVAVPTETVYGLAADATSPDAIARIYAAKGRPTDHPLIVHLADPEDLLDVAA